MRVEGRTLKITIHDDFGATKELTVDPFIRFCASEHAIQCAECHQWRLEEHAIEDEKNGLWYCSPEHRSEYHASWREFYYGG